MTAHLTSTDWSTLVVLCRIRNAQGVDGDQLLADLDEGLARDVARAMLGEDLPEQDNEKLRPIVHKVYEMAGVDLPSEGRVNVA